MIRRWTMLVCAILTRVVLMACRLEKVRFNGRHFALGVTQIVIGAVCIVLEILDIGFGGNGILILPIIAFAVAIAAGILGVIASRSQIRGVFIASMVLSILAALYCTTSITIEVSHFVHLQVINTAHKYVSKARFFKFVNVFILMIAEICIAILQAVFSCCIGTCSCCKDDMRQNSVPYTEMTNL